MAPKPPSAHSGESRSSQRSDKRPRDSRHPSSAGGRRRQDGWRETIESIVIAFILAFLFRAFEAEAFVIPTGSMAPTLRGRNKEVVCDECGYHFDIGASSEVDDDEFLIGRISNVYCPNCRYQMPTPPSNPPDEVRNLPVFKGDRILVNKFPYEFGTPRRWDVVVFKYPEEPKTNYIKRCVGLPNETLELRQGDVYALRDGKSQILRKDPYKQKAIQLPVYDNDYPPRKLLENGWPECWAAVTRDQAPGSIAGWSEETNGWIADPGARSFRLDADRTGDGRYRWIRFRHFVPDQNAWKAALAGNKPPITGPVLITDFCGYNASEPGMGPVDFGVYWVHDLTVSCRVDVTEANEQSELLLELNAGARRYRCRINVSSGEATLSHNVAMAGNADAGQANGSGEVEEKILATAETGFKGAGSYRVRFANVDNRLCLWIDGRLADFGERAEYIPYGGLLVRQQPQEADLIPVGIAARGTTLTVSHLLVQRDIYYRSEFLRPGEIDDIRGEVIHEYDYISPADESFRRWQAKLSDPAAWYEDYITNLSANKIGKGEKYEDVSFRFVLGPDEFFMMGDNSPRSKDSRLWGNHRGAKHRYAVPRSALVGKAFYVYWPHGIPFLNGGRGYPDGPQSLLDHGMMRRFFYHQVVRRDRQGRPVEIKIDDDYPTMRIPFYPDITRMRRIR